MNENLSEEELRAREWEVLNLLTKDIKTYEIQEYLVLFGTGILGTLIYKYYNGASRWLCLIVGIGCGMSGFGWLFVKQNRLLKLKFAVEQSRLSRDTAKKLGIDLKTQTHTNS